MKVEWVKTWIGDFSQDDEYTCQGERKCNVRFNRKPTSCLLEDEQCNQTGLQPSKEQSTPTHVVDVPKCV